MNANTSSYACLRFHAKFEVNGETREVMISKHSHLQCVAEQPGTRTFHQSLYRQHPTTPRYENCQDVQWHAFHNARFGGQRALEIIKELRLVEKKYSCNIGPGGEMNSKLLTKVPQQGGDTTRPVQHHLHSRPGRGSVALSVARKRCEGAQEEWP